MIGWSNFCRHMMSLKGKLTHSVWLEIAREGKARLVERLQAGRADSVLDFRDLVSRAEDALLRN